eukprot:jgi/Botrbrau1/22134/Bobra.0206s0058.1
MVSCRVEGKQVSVPSFQQALQGGSCSVAVTATAVKGSSSLSCAGKSPTNSTRTSRLKLALEPIRVSIGGRPTGRAEPKLLIACPMLTPPRQGAKGERLYQQHPFWKVYCYKYLPSGDRVLVTLLGGTAVRPREATIQKLQITRMPPPCWAVCSRHSLPSSQNRSRIARGRRGTFGRLLLDPFGLPARGTLTGPSFGNPARTRKSGTLESLSGTQP